MLVLVVAALLLPRVAPRFAANSHVRTLAWAWVWLIAAQTFNASAVVCASKDAFALAWTCYGLAATCATALVVTVFWRTVTTQRRREG